MKLLGHERVVGYWSGLALESNVLIFAMHTMFRIGTILSSYYSVASVIILELKNG